MPPGCAEERQLCSHAVDDRPIQLRSSYTMRTKCAISDAFVRDCVFAYCASVVQYVYSLSAEHFFRLRKNAITDERVRDCAFSTHSVFRPLGWTREINVICVGIRVRRGASRLFCYSFT